MKQYGLIGYPLGHSFSKKFFTEKFEDEQIDARYEAFELETVERFMDIIKQYELHGLNVTIPYKEQIIPYLNELDPIAKAIGAVNVIKFQRTSDGLKLKGFNSDAIGFQNSLTPFLRECHRKALILGTGGASKAIDYVLRSLGIETIYVSRSAAPGRITYAELNKEIMSDYLLVVNASPVGTYPHVDECPAIPYEYIGENHLFYDVVYNPKETLFLKKGKERGAIGINGEKMLVGQALAAWDIWNL